MGGGSELSRADSSSGFPFANESRLLDTLNSQSIIDEEASLTALTNQRAAPWNPLQWLEVRQQLVEDGQIKDLPNLMKSVRLSSAKALHRQKYETEDGQTTVDLSEYLAAAECVRWFGRSNVLVPNMPPGFNKGLVEPPMICIDMSPLDIVTQLALYGEHDLPVYCVIEVSDFEPDGTLNLGLTRATTAPQQNLIVRTDFSRYAEAASSSLRSGRCSVRDHLTAPHDPYVFYCPSMTLFRGSRDDGYPFLEKPVKLNGIVSAMPGTRPAVTMTTTPRTGEKTQWYSSDLDQTALLERLSLIGFAAAQEIDTGTKPILVLSALGCTDRGFHPRDAVANSLKHWRTRFARLFHTVFLACGPDPELTEQFDIAINRQVYAGLVAEDVSGFAEWHWERRIITMHINSSDLHTIADLVDEQNRLKQIEKDRLQAMEEREQARQRELKEMSVEDRDVKTEEELRQVQSLQRPERRRSVSRKQVSPVPEEGEQAEAVGKQEPEDEFASSEEESETSEDGSQAVKIVSSINLISTSHEEHEDGSQAVKIVSSINLISTSHEEQTLLTTEGESNQEEALHRKSEGPENDEVVAERGRSLKISMLDDLTGVMEEHAFHQTAHSKEEKEVGFLFDEARRQKAKDIAKGRPQSRSLSISVAPSRCSSRGSLSGQSRQGSISHARRRHSSAQRRRSDDRRHSMSVDPHSARKLSVAAGTSERRESFVEVDQDSTKDPDESQGHNHHRASLLDTSYTGGTAAQGSLLSQHLMTTGRGPSLISSLSKSDDDFGSLESENDPELTIQEKMASKMLEMKRKSFVSSGSIPGMGPPAVNKKTLDAEHVKTAAEIRAETRNHLLNRGTETDESTKEQNLDPSGRRGSRVRASLGHILLDNDEIEKLLESQEMDEAKKEQGSGSTCCTKDTSSAPDTTGGVERESAESKSPNPANNPGDDNAPNQSDAEPKAPSTHEPIMRASYNIRTIRRASMPHMEEWQVRDQLAELADNFKLQCEMFYSSPRRKALRRDSKTQRHRRKSKEEGMDKNADMPTISNSPRATRFALKGLESAMANDKGFRMKESTIADESPESPPTPKGPLSVKADRSLSVKADRSMSATSNSSQSHGKGLKEKTRLPSVVESPRGNRTAVKVEDDSPGGHANEKPHSLGDRMRQRLGGVPPLAETEHLEPPYSARGFAKGRTVDFNKLADIGAHNLSIG